MYRALLGTFFPQNPGKGYIHKDIPVVPVRQAPRPPIGSRSAIREPPTLSATGERRYHAAALPHPDRNGRANPVPQTHGRKVSTYAIWGVEAVHEITYLANKPCVSPLLCLGLLARLPDLFLYRFCGSFA
jgi:hypothetical protein